MELRFLLIMMFSIYLTACGGGGGGSASSVDFSFIDRYLTDWDRFAQGANELAPRLKSEFPRFEQQLADALNQGDKRAASRLVFFAVVRVGGFVPYESALGRACEKLVRGDAPIFTSDKGERSYFAGDLYFWWDRHKAEFVPFSLLDEWRQRDFVKATVMPMYEAATKKR